MMADWCMLPDEILGEIALRLDSIEDFIYFSTVCRSWLHAHAMVKELWTMRMPWLLLVETTKDNPNHYRKLFCPSSKRCYQIKLPETFGARCWGSSCGWVVTFDLNLEFHLVNPLTRARITLPPQPTMRQRHYDSIEENDRHWMRQVYVDKALVFIDGGSDSDDCFVIAIHGVLDGSYLAYARPGDQAWTPLVTTEINKVDRRVSCRPHDIVQWGSQMLFLFYNGTLGYCDVSALRNSQPAIIMEYLPAPLKILDELREGLYRIYLVESFGDLLILLRYKEQVVDPDDPDYDIFYRTLGFEVYKLNFGAKTWEEVDDLGDVAIFVGNNSSMSVHASGINNCKRNCIYFTDDEWQMWHSPTLFGGHDIGRFNMEGSVIEKVYEGDDVHSSFCPPLWFMPKIYF